MEVRVIKPFHDIKEDVTRNVGDIFTVSDGRYKELKKTKVGKLVEAVAEETAKPKAKKKPAKKG